MPEGKRLTILIIILAFLIAVFIIIRNFDRILYPETGLNASGNALENILKERYESLKIKEFPAEKKDFTGTFSSRGPEINGTHAVVVDLTTNNILFEKKARESAPIASLTKIMTAVVALEHKNLDKKITVSEKAASIGENVMGITAGETYTLEDLLYGLILNSGNDAAYAIAEGIAGTETNFTYWMNFKARELGLTNTVFADPSGLNDNTSSTALDLAKLARYALLNPDFRKISQALEYETYGENDHKYVYLENQTNLLRTYPGVKGIKTGYTEAAGLCLVTYAENGGHELIGVVLGSSDRKGDMIQILDFAFGKVGVFVGHPLLDY